MKKMIQLIFFHLLLIVVLQNTLSSNPFYIDFPAIQTPSTEDYTLLQKEIKKLDVETTVKDFYPRDGLTKSLLSKTRNLLGIGGFIDRCSVGKNLRICVPEEGLFPVTDIIKINQGGKNCIVTFASYNLNYAKCLEKFIEGLKKTGFNGWLYYRLGGYPNPSGTELSYAGVPYSFKVFTMLEAAQKGFENILWIDCGFYPLRDPSWFFHHIDKKNYLFFRQGVHEVHSEYIFRETRECIKEMTGIDPLECGPILGGIFGMKMSHQKNKELIESYYQLVKEGTPFISCFPEEFVLGSLVDLYWGRVPSPIPQSLLRSPTSENVDRDIAHARRKRVFFFYSKNCWNYF